MALGIEYYSNIEDGVEKSYFCCFARKAFPCVVKDFLWRSYSLRKWAWDFFGVKILIHCRTFIFHLILSIFVGNQDLHKSMD